MCMQKLATLATQVELPFSKKNEVLSFAVTRMNLKIIIQSEVSHIEKDNYYMISLTCGI